jgi:hypothetical protein
MVGFDQREKSRDTKVRETDAWVGKSDRRMPSGAEKAGSLIELSCGRGIASATPEKRATASSEVKWTIAQKRIDEDVKP